MFNILCESRYSNYYVLETITVISGFLLSLNLFREKVAFEITTNIGVNIYMYIPALYTSVLILNNSTYGVLFSFTLPPSG